MSISIHGLTLQPETPPLELDEGGTLRVAKSRVSLGLVIEQYENGMTPDALVRAYDTLALAEVHSILAYYLRHRDEVRAYLKDQETKAQSLAETVVAQRPALSREELLARQSADEKSHAPTGE